MRGFLLAAAMMAGAAGNNRFAIELYAQLRGGAGNVVVSPFNVAEALAMTERGASGETARELRAVTHASASKSGAAWKALLADTGQSGVVSATALWTNGDALRNKYVAAVKDEFGATAQALDFSKKSAAASRINAWVAYRTHNNIRSLVTPEDVSPKTRVVLTAAIWMKSAWKTRFAAGNTRDLPFYLSGNRQAKVPTMQQRSYFRYAKVVGARLIELPYSAKRLTMLVVLPDARNGLSSVESALSSATIARWTGALEESDVELKVPRFNAASSFSLVAPLQRLGVRRLFDRRGAELSGMIASSTLLFVSDVRHLARIVVDEEGTEASAAFRSDTEWTSTTAPAPPQPFIADHPFLYIIRSGEQILFIGRVMDPRS